MALVLADRVKETSTTTGTGTYILAGAVTGFESFASIGNGNTTYYACTLGSDFEVGIGTYTASGTTLARTTILQSSNSDNAVDWGAGTKTLFCTQPAEKAVFLDSDGNIATFNGSNLTNVNATTLDSIDSGSFLRSDAADTKTSGDLTFSDDVKALFGTGSDLEIYHDGSNSFIRELGTGRLLIDSNGTGIDLRKNASENLAKFITDGAVELYHDSNLKFSTSSTGATVTGTLVADGLTMGDSENITLGDGSDFKIRHSGTASVIQDTNSSTQTFIQDDNALRITTVNATQNSAIFYPNAQVELYNNGTKIFNTVSTGAKITGDLTLTSTDDGATENPTLDLYRNSANPDVNDVLGHIDFSGMNDADTPEKVVYAQINADIADETDNTEDGRLDIRVISNGSLANRITLQGNGHTLFHSRDVRLQASVDLVFEGSVTNGTRTTLTVVNPNQANTISLPDASGQVVLADGDVDTDASAEIGRAHVGHMGFSDLAGFSHVDQNSTTGYALVQNSSGQTFLNGLTSIGLLIGNSNVAFVNDIGFNINTGKVLKFEGSTADGNELTVTVTDPTDSRTITLPDASGTVLTTGNSDAPTTTTSSSDADFVLIDDGGVMKKITPTDLGVGGGGGGGITTGKAIAMAIVFG